MSSNQRAERQGSCLISIVCAADDLQAASGIAPHGFAILASEQSKRREWDQSFTPLASLVSGKSLVLFDCRAAAAAVRLARPIYRTLLLGHAQHSGASHNHGVQGSSRIVLQVGIATAAEVLERRLEEAPRSTKPRNHY